MALPEFAPDLPWALGASLLLDGVSVPNPLQRVWEWGGTSMAQALYAQTQWAELTDISPCLVRVSGPDDPVLEHYKASGQPDWGCLLFSVAPWMEQVQHLRGLLQVVHPQGEGLLLRLADATIVHALFGNPDSADAGRLFGPFQEVLGYDLDTEQWSRLQSPVAPHPINAPQPYRLRESDLERLGQVRQHQVLEGLDGHMHTHFPAWGEQWDRPARRAELRALADQAYARGFCGEDDLYRYANLFGLLGPNALEDHPHVANQLDARDSRTPSQRLKDAADLAYALSLLKRTSP
ncbi:DUF4123 domain-containing protein [Metapseudomonas otitidis]|uniref:DUF4123 domain-containing protein n=1 Tax=Metapseudomonas otitidis TaxID=319939 RepID=UPI0013DF3434|nr:DUF4123 domain-containing protein [Pseudomonas otitidis]